jgi:hypothetical protein
LRPTTRLLPPDAVESRPGSSARRIAIAAAVALTLAIALFAAGSLALHDGSDMTRFGVRADDWPATDRRFDRLADEAGFRVRYAHDVPDGWRLAEATAVSEPGSGTAVRLVYRDAGGLDVVVMQRMAVMPVLREADEIETSRGGGTAFLRWTSDESATVRWQDGRVALQAVSRFAGSWHVGAFLDVLDSIH